MIALGIPFLGIKFNTVSASVLPTSASARLVDDALKANFPPNRTAPLEVVIGSDQLFDPVGRPDAAAARARELHDAGATTLSLRFVHDSVDHYVEQLEAMTEVAENL